jgi:hypothetical protein
MLGPVWILFFLSLALNLDAQPADKRPAILPDHMKLQVAGTIGLFAAGFGYESRNEKMNYDFFYGYVPEDIGGVQIHSVTGKFTWAAVSIKRMNHRIDILSTGFLVNFAFGKQYYLISPPNYPASYYGFPTSAHTALFLGSGVRIKRLGIYYELLTTGKELVSFIPNLYSLKLSDILSFGVGLRYGLF